MNFRFLLKSQFICCIFICITFMGCISEGPRECDPSISEFSLKFIYTFNEDRIDLFKKEVEYVEVFLFNENHTFIKKIGTYVSSLNDNALELQLPEGIYTAVVWGNTHSPEFLVSNEEDLEKIDQLQVSLNVQNDQVNKELPKLFHGKETFIVQNQKEKQIQPVYLSRNTKIIRVLFTGINREYNSLLDVNQQIIISGTNGDYLYDNTIQEGRTISYLPYSENKTRTNNDLLVVFNTLQITENSDLRVKVWDTRTEMSPDIDTDLLPYILKDQEPEDVAEFLKYTHEFALQVNLSEVYGGYVAVSLKMINWSDIHDDWEEISTPGNI